MRIHLCMCICTHKLMAAGTSDRVHVCIYIYCFCEYVLYETTDGVHVHICIYCS